MLKPLLLAMLVAGPAMAQPATWQSWQQNHVTRWHEGTDAGGGKWTGQSYRQGFTDYLDLVGPDGQTQHCRAWKQGFEVLTQCDR